MYIWVTEDEKEMLEKIMEHYKQVCGEYRKHKRIPVFEGHIDRLLAELRGGGRVSNRHKDSERII